MRLHHAIFRRLMPKHNAYESATGEWHCTRVEDKVLKLAGARGDLQSGGGGGRPPGLSSGTEASSCVRTHLP